MTSAATATVSFGDVSRHSGTRAQMFAWRVLIMVCVVLWTLPARAAELDIAERKWVRQCIDAIGSDSERVGTSAGDALTSFGIECVPVVIRLSGKLESDTSWARLGRALDGMGPVSAADELDAHKTQWPEGSKTRLREFVAALRAGSFSTAPLAVGGTSPPEIERQVREILETFRGTRSYRSPNPEVRRLIGLGRSAIPALVASTVREAESSADHAQGFVDTAACDALKDLCTVADAPVLIAALERGASVAASVLHDLDTPAVTDALLAAVARHQVTHDVIEAIQVRARDERVPKAVARFLEESYGGFALAVGPACLLVADAGYDDGLAAIRLHLMKSDLPFFDRRQVVEAAAILGDHEGLALLVSVLLDDSVPEEQGGKWERHRAGIALNRLTGNSFYKPLGVPGLPSRLPGWRRNRLRPGDIPAAAKLYSAWWSKNADTIQYVRASRTWRTP